MVTRPADFRRADGVPLASDLVNVPSNESSPPPLDAQDMESLLASASEEELQQMLAKGFLRDGGSTALLESGFRGVPGGGAKGSTPSVTSVTSDAEETTYFNLDAISRAFAGASPDKAPSVATPSATAVGKMTRLAPQRRMARGSVWRESDEQRYHLGWISAVRIISAVALVVVGYRLLGVKRFLAQLWHMLKPTQRGMGGRRQVMRHAVRSPRAG